MSPPLLEVDDLHLHFFTENGIVYALNGVSFQLEEGEVVGVVGESGCGKSMTARCILRLLPHTAEIQKGRILFRGTDLLGLGERDMRKLRGARIAMIFQEPASALNPVLTIGDQIAEALRWHATTDRAAARERALEMLGLVGMPNPIRTSRQYVHELSGGMQQRAMIAMALATDPDLLIADEPTTALDVTIQAQIMDLLQRLKESGVISSILFITHDFGLVAHMCDKVAVMYGGIIAEFAPTTELFDNPGHPYTQGLFRALPQGRPIGQPFGTIRGTVPSLLEVPPGCMFHPRCDRVIEGLCPRMAPALRLMTTDHEVACHLYEARQGAPP